jgi:hypothetical protein
VVQGSVFDGLSKGEVEALRNGLGSKRNVKQTQLYNEDKQPVQKGQRVVKDDEDQKKK